MSSLIENSPHMNVIAVTLTAGTNIVCGEAGTTDADGADLFSSRPVRSCLVQQYSGTQVYMAFKRAATAAATSWKLSTTPVAVPIQDLADLQFIGTAGDVVQIMYRT